jgi:hypothetical protein
MNSPFNNSGKQNFVFSNKQPVDFSINNQPTTKVKLIHNFLHNLNPLDTQYILNKILHNCSTLHNLFTLRFQQNTKKLTNSRFLMIIVLGCPFISIYSAHIRFLHFLLKGSDAACKIHTLSLDLSLDRKSFP